MVSKKFLFTLKNPEDWTIQCYWQSCKIVGTFQTIEHSISVEIFHENGRRHDTCADPLIEYTYVDLPFLNNNMAQNELKQSAPMKTKPPSILNLPLISASILNPPPPTSDSILKLPLKLTSNIHIHGQFRVRHPIP